ncbi:MAG: rhomboid family intramembrane serine protease [Clostridia bacterium]|nr:rhomboid family intramembrane serine protease [Clostridia bacterium]
MEQKKGIRLHWNAPAVLTFTLICVIVMALDELFAGKVTQLFFSVRRSSLLDPLTYVRLFGHVLGHADWNHLLGNMMTLLIVGPLAEEKYGTSNMWFLMLTTALVTGLIQMIFFPGASLLGASGVVFALILLASITSVRQGSIPITFILVAALYIGEQVYSMFTTQGNISYMAHIVGGLIGAGLGYLMNRWRMIRWKKGGVA